MAGLQSDQLFLGLTRPTMVLGVHYLLFLVNMMGNILLFINLTTNNKIIIVILTFVSAHLVAYLVCLKEPRAIELFFARYAKCTRCRNRFYHKNTNSYDLR